MKNFRSPDGPDSNWNVAQPMAKPAGFAKKTAGTIALSGLGDWQGWRAAPDGGAVTSSLHIATSCYRVATSSSHTETSSLHTVKASLHTETQLSGLETR